VSAARSLAGGPSELRPHDGNVAARTTVRAATRRTRFEKYRGATITDIPYVGGGTNYTSCRAEELVGEAAFADE